MKQVQDNIKHTKKALVNAWSNLNAVYNTLGNDKTLATPKERQQTKDDLQIEIDSMRKLLDDIEKDIEKDINTNTI